MEISVEPSKTYAVTTSGSCTVTDADGLELCTASSGSQAFFVATTPTVTISDDGAKVSRANFKHAALALGLLGGGKNDLPAGYTRVEFLESTGTQAIVLPVNIKEATSWSTRTEVQFTELPAQGTGAQEGSNSQYQWGAWGSASGGVSMFMSANNASGNLNIGKVWELSSSWTTLSFGYDAPSHRWGAWGSNSAEDEGSKGPPNVPEFVLFCVKSYGNFAFYQKARKKWLILKADGKTLYSLIPALDPTGAPCMFDLVTRQPFYNSGTGDFLYPGKETTATTYSLRRLRQYAQMTERGIRRLYHVPRGYNGTPEEYAEQNGFKILVETPAPEEGYWTPVWHEREDCIELEWVETESPEEELLNVE